MHNKILNIALYSICLNIVFIPLNNTVAAFFGYLAVLCCIMHPILRSYKEGKLNLYYHVFWLLYVLVFIVSSAASSEYFEIQGLKYYVISLVSFLALYWSMSFEPEENSCNINSLFRINYVLCFIFILFSFGPFSFNRTVVNEWGVEVFNMGLGNSNMAASYVMFSVVILLIQLISIRSLAKKIFNIILFGALIYILFLLASRTVGFCIIVVIIFCLFRSRRKIGKAMPYIIMIIPLLMIFFQVFIWQRHVDFNIMGKALDSGRSDIYTALFAEISASPQFFIFGLFFKYPFVNMHNAPLSILASTGLVGLLLYYLFWIRQIKMLYHTSNNTRIQIVAFVAILSFFIHSSSEAMMMIGTIPYAIFTLLIVKIAKGDYKLLKK